MSRTTIAVILSVALAGCDQPVTQRPDNQLRREIFMECLQKAPAGPQVVKYNDWSEVVDSCARAAYYQSLPGRTP